jgi:hypothetical protein
VAKQKREVELPSEAPPLFLLADTVSSQNVEVWSFGVISVEWEQQFGYPAWEADNLAL